MSIADPNKTIPTGEADRQNDAIGPKPTWVAEQRRVAETRRLLSAASYDTIRVPGCYDF
jgi:hypothetical protein